MSVTWPPRTVYKHCLAFGIAHGSSCRRHLVVALFAPVVHRPAGRARGWILALAPLGVFLHFATAMPASWTATPSPSINLDAATVPWIAKA
jgi:hypothetical protein